MVFVLVFVACSFAPARRGIAALGAAHSIEPSLADESAQQGIDPAGASCPCVRSLGSAAARDGSDIECRCCLTNLTPGDRVDALLLPPPTPPATPPHVLPS